MGRATMALIISVALFLCGCNNSAAPSGKSQSNISKTTSVALQQPVLAVASVGLQQGKSFNAGGPISPDQPGPSDLYFTIHSQKKVHAISRFIYGINGHAFDSRPVNLTLTRSGGNRMTTYNWETNASNGGSDWANQNDACLGGGDTPGGAVTRLIDNAMTNTAGCIVTIPMIGRVAADKLSGSDVNQTTGYLDSRFHLSLPAKGDTFQLTPDLSDHAVYQDEWVYFLTQAYPEAMTSAVSPIFFSLDNEPDLWAETHPRLRVVGEGGAVTPVTYAELIEKTIAYADAIKAVAPGAIVFGPVTYGWQGMVSLQDATDANGRDFLAVYLDAMAEAETNYGRRLLDVLDIHWYPDAQGDGTRITEDDNSDAVAQARMQAPRSLWDPTYMEDSWITQGGITNPIRLLHRLQDKIKLLYPGTRIAVSEYCYGGGDHISGGIAQADVLGILGRENVFAAALRKPENTNQRFIFGAFDMFRNFDGYQSSFGDFSVQASSSDITKASIYASIDAGNEDRMVVICINKSDKDLTAGITVTHSRRFLNAAVYTLTGSISYPQPRSAIPITKSNAFQYTMPALSVSTLVLRP